MLVFFFQAEDGIRNDLVTGVQTCALPIFGDNQALQHRATEMFVALEQGRSLAILAAMMVEEPDAAERARNIAMVKVGVGQAAHFVSQNAVQLHGGIGMTEEYAVGHYFRRVMVIEHSFGDTAHHLSRLADAVK